MRIRPQIFLLSLAILLLSSNLVLAEVLPSDGELQKTPGQ